MEKEGKKIDAVVYIRVSTEEQAVHGYSPSNKRSLLQMAEELGAGEGFNLR